MNNLIWYIPHVYFQWYYQDFVTFDHVLVSFLLTVHYLFSEKKQDKTNKQTNMPEKKCRGVWTTTPVEDESLQVKILFYHVDDLRRFRLVYTL